MQIRRNLPAVLLLLLFISISSRAQSDSSLFLLNSKKTVLTRPPSVPHSLYFYGDSGKFFGLTFDGDTLRLIGNVSLDTAASHFMQHIIDVYSTRMRELRREIDLLRKRLN